MATEFRCGKCGKAILADQPVGSAVHCPACGATLIVPGPTQPESNVVSHAPHPVRAQPSGVTTNIPVAAIIESTPVEQEVYVEGALSERTVGILAAVMPWAVSLVFHAGIFLIMFFAFTAREIVANEEAERIIIPDARLSENPGGLVDFGSVSPDLKAVGIRHQVKAHEYRRLPAKDMMAGVGTGTGTGGGSGGGTGKGTGGGEGEGAGGGLKIIGIGVGGGGGPISGYGVGAGGGGDGPRAAFYGSGGNAYKVCYVIDRSGSMLDTFDYLRDELKRSIRELVPQQQFHVVFFSAGKPEELPPGKLVYATPANKEKAYKYLDAVVPSGQTVPGPALERAFACKPELIYFMTDGDFDPKVLELLQRLNRDKRVKINTFSFVFKPGEALLKQIASEHGGRYKHVSEDDLGQ